jgi:hypothetical protein
MGLKRKLAKQYPEGIDAIFSLKKFIYPDFTNKKQIKV